MIVSTKRKIPSPKIGLICFAALLACNATQTLSAQQNEEFFRDTWVAKSPEQGSIVLLLKQNGRAAYFWADNADRSVYTGSWNYEEGSATLTWEDGSTHVLIETDNGFTITYSGINAGETYSSPAQKLPQNLLGQWARPPERQEDELSDRDRAKGYFGTWKVSGENGTHYIFIEADRSAASNRNPDGSEGRGLRGAWAKQGADLHIAWNTGHYSIIRQSARSYSYKRIEPGQIIEEDTQKYSPCERSDDSRVPAEWLARYKKERDAPQVAVAFSSRKDAIQFYRGDWLVRHRKDAYEKIRLGRFGGLSTSRNPDIEGSWLMSGQDIFMRWNDGIRRILSPIADGFLLYEYKPGRPLDGIPTRIHPAAPADAKKLATHLNSRESAAQAILEMAREAGIEPNDSDGFGSNFSRWAWPFSKQTEKSASSALFSEESIAERPDLNTPWWWPLWSEKQTPEIEEENNTAEIADATSTEEPEPRIPNQQTAEPKKWYWPF
ncbi:MAG: hypothetical protein ACON39_06240 [Coraliomargaritaceae bacterium]